MAEKQEPQDDPIRMMKLTRVQLDQM